MMFSMSTSQPQTAPLWGVVLAAGAGTRYGGPKALAVDAEGSWLVRAVNLMLATGCERVGVVLGAEHERAMKLLPDSANVCPIIAHDWADGQGASLKGALNWALSMQTDTQRTEARLVITLVDLPQLRVESALRVTGAGQDDPANCLAQAWYHGAPGHPVVIGSNHWQPLTESLTGDTGAKHYLAAHHSVRIDCSELGGGNDVDYGSIAQPDV